MNIHECAQCTAKLRVPYAHTIMKLFPKDCVEVTKADKRYRVNDVMWLNQRLIMDILLAAFNMLRGQCLQVHIYEGALRTRAVCDAKCGAFW